MSAVLLLVTSPGAAGALGGSAPSFAAARSYGTGNGPNSLAIGDLNGDSKPDLVTANYDELVGSLSVLLNRGDGRFRAKVDYAPGRSFRFVAVGDLTGDRNLDLAITNPGRTVSVLVNKGDGSFVAERNYRIGFQPGSIALGELNGDGKTDLVAANGMNTVSVLHNRGDEGFEPGLDYRTGRGPSVAIGDLNGDRRPDLVTANVAAATVSVLLNRGNGSFRAAREYRTGRRSAEPAPLSVAIGDLNGDRAPDLATANYGDANTVSVLLNKGNGTFGPRREHRTGPLPASVAIADLNGDGKPDLATANQGSRTVSVLTNRGDGSFNDRVDFAHRRGSGAVAIADLNGDRRQDLVTANHRANNVSVLTNTPGLCTVQNVQRKMLRAARRTMARATCRAGRISRAYSKSVEGGRVISQRPLPGAVLPGGGRVDLVVSLGRRPS